MSTLSQFAEMMALGAPAPIVVTWDTAHDGGAIDYSNGNRTVTRQTGSGYQSGFANISFNPSDGVGRYWEVSASEPTTAPYDQVGVAGPDAYLVDGIGASTVGWTYYAETGETIHYGTRATYGAAWGNGSVIGIAVKGGKIWFAKNGTWQHSGNPAAGTGAAFSGLPSLIVPAYSLYSDLRFLTIRAKTADFTYSPPSGFSALQP